MLIAFYKKNRERILFLLGLLAVSMIVLPYAILGKGSYVQVHDQMDGEILNYIYQAKYLFQGNVIPEFMNGMDKAAMLPPAPLGVLFFKVLPPFGAFALMHWVSLITGFAGMFLLCRYGRLRTEICFVTACLFCYIPFYPVYGLASLGQPMLVYCFLRLLTEEKKTWGFLSGICFYGAMSSLTLIGYVWVAFGVVCTLVLLVGKKKNMAFKSAAGTGILTGVYLITNLDLLQSLFGGGFETHRSEMVLTATEDLLARGKELLLAGGSYSPVYSACILVAAVFFLCAGGWRLWKSRKNAGRKEERTICRCTKAVASLLGVLLIGIFVAVLWNCQAVVNVRLQIGGMVAYFQADRIYWTFPFLWMFLLGWVLEGLWVWGDSLKDRVGIWAKYVVLGLCIILVMAEGLQILRDNTLNKNLRLVLLKNYEQVTWESLYMEDVFEQIDEVIGEEKDKVSVVSLGIYPSVALYHGYTCADGYSNNYRLNYKHIFREIIRKELDKDPDAKAYFDDWGNRLYLTASPYGINGMVSKREARVYEDVAYDVEAMKALNIGYLFAAAPVRFQEEIQENFSLVEGSPFTSDESYYEVWIYKIQ